MAARGSPMMWPSARAADPATVRNSGDRKAKLVVMGSLTEAQRARSRFSECAVNRARDALLHQLLPEVEQITQFDSSELQVSVHHVDAVKLIDHVGQHARRRHHEDGVLHVVGVGRVALLLRAAARAQALALKWEDVDLEAGTAKTQAEDNKGKRDAIIGIHPLVVEYIRKIRGFHPAVFPWLKNERKLWTVFHKIQEAAGISGPYYGFHDLGRGFATVNAENMTADALQRLMQHRSYTTTQRYINMAQQVKTAVANLHVPDVLRKAN